MEREREREREREALFVVRRFFFGLYSLQVPNGDDDDGNGGDGITLMVDRRHRGDEHDQVREQVTVQEEREQRRGGHGGHGLLRAGAKDTHTETYRLCACVMLCVCGEVARWRGLLLIFAWIDLSQKSKQKSRALQVGRSIRGTRVFRQYITVQNISIMYG